VISNAISSKQVAELLRRETSIADDAAHRERVHRVVPWDSHDPPSIRHHDMLALPGDPEPNLFECPDGPKVRDSRYLRHPLCRNFHFPQVLLTGKFLGDFEVFPNRVLDVRQSFLFGGTLRPAPREARAGNAVPLFGWYQSHWVLHTYHCIIAVENMGTTSVRPAAISSQQPVGGLYMVVPGARNGHGCRKPAKAGCGFQQALQSQPVPGPNSQDLNGSAFNQGIRSHVLFPRMRTFVIWLGCCSISAQAR
jgi:hypothetical protein